VYEKIGGGGNDSDALRVIPAVGYSPCPINRRCRARLWWCQPRPAFL